MAEEFGLVLKSDSTQIQRATRDLDELARKGKKAEQSTDDLGESSKRTAGNFKMLAGVVTSVVAGLATSKLVTVTRDFQLLEAQLVTATGSAEGASIAFGALQDFAATTPYALEQSIEAFTKLVNLGLTPSERALRSYGDTASAMGKDLMQLVEAVADASTGEFERLKEFGIKSKVEGDKVVFAFRGAKTEVANNAAAIEEFLIGLGETNFAGSMQNQMATLQGAMSNLSDSWDNLWRVVSEGGAGEQIEQAVRMAIVAVEELTAMIESGQLGAQISAIGDKFQGFADDATNAIIIVTDILQSAGIDWKASGEQGASFLGEAFMNFPENVRTAIQLATVEIASFLDRAAALGDAIKDVVNPFDEVTAAEAIARFDEVNATISEARAGSIESIMMERDAALSSFDQQITAANSLRAEYEAIKAAKAEATTSTDQLAGFGVGAGGADREAQAEAARQKRLEDLQKQFATEEEMEILNQQRKMELFNEWAELEELSELEKKERLELLEQEHQDRLNDIREKSMTEAQKIQAMGMASQVALVAGGLGDMLGAFSSGSDKFLKVSRIFGATQALIATFVGQAEALKLGWPLGIIAAAKIAAAGFGFVNAIKGGGSSKRGGGGRPASLSAGSPQLQAQQAPAPRQTLDFRFSTGGRRMFRDEEVQEMMNSMAERMADGDNIFGSAGLVS